MGVTPSSTHTTTTIGAIGTQPSNIHGLEANTWNNLLGWRIRKLIEGNRPTGTIKSYFDYGHSFIVEIEWDDHTLNEMVLVPNDTLDEYSDGYTFFNGERFIIFRPNPLICNCSRNLYHSS